MREILFLAHRVPWPADRGDKIRSHNLLKKLSEFAPVHVGAFADDDRDAAFAEDMRPLFSSVYVERRAKPLWKAGLEALASGKPVSITGFASSDMRSWVRELIASGKISHIVVFSGQMAQYVPRDFDGYLIMDFVDVDSAKFESYARKGNPAMRWVNRREADLLADFEHAFARRADASLFVSEAEAQLFRNRSGLGHEKVIALSNGIDAVFYDPQAKFPPPTRKFNGPLIVFTGQMDYRPNVEAVCDFARNAMPAVLRAHPKAKFVIVGRKPTQEVQALAKTHGVEVTGAVDDVRSWLGAADVVVAPLRIARGIQNKVLEAMAMAKPVVASPAAAEGIAATSGTHFLIADDAEQEAQSVIKLLDDPQSGLNIGAAARLHVIGRYSWASQLAALSPLMGISHHLAEAAE